MLINDCMACGKATVANLCADCSIPLPHKSKMDFRCPICNSSHPTIAGALNCHKGTDPVNNPPHYTQGKIEVLDFILDQKLDYLPGQVIKYICRSKYKGNELQDLEKAQFYLNRLIKNLKNE